jgi:hypothetical protein
MPINNLAYDICKFNFSTFLKSFQVTYYELYYLQMCSANSFYKKECIGFSPLHLAKGMYWIFTKIKLQNTTYVYLIFASLVHLY